MPPLLAEWFKRLRPEDPRRMHQFRERMQHVSWDKSALLDSLSTLFDAVDDLAEAEVRYYYRRRGTRAWLSGLFRLAAWVFGAIGLLVPLLAATGEPFTTWGPYGYVSLALAASFLAANALFGGTTGHVRFVSTQLELEKLVTSSRIAWYRYVARVRAMDLTDEEIENGFVLIQAYAQSLYAATIAEAGHWGEALLAELLKYQKTIEESKAGGKHH